MIHSTIVFDLDGTLLNTVGDIEACMHEALVELSLPAQEFDRRFRIGPPLFDAVQEALPECSEQEIKAFIDLFREKYDRSEYLLTHPYPGIQKLLNDLTEEGASLFIATNKRKKPTLRLLKHFQWNSLFREVITFDLFDDRIMSKVDMLLYLLERHWISPQRGVMIGDSCGDILAGQRCGMDTIAVSWGYETIEKLRTSEPTHFVNSSEEIFTRLVNLGE